MSSSAPLTRTQKRLMKEIEIVRKAVREDPLLGIGAKPVRDSDLYKWEGVIEGPPNSPFAGGWFRVSIVFPPQYPSKPPSIKFLSKIFHPNVYSNGSICIDILQNAWSPVLKITGVLTSLRSLLDDPNPASPANCDAARAFRDDKENYARLVRNVMEQDGCMTERMPNWYLEWVDGDRCSAAASSSSSSSSTSARDAMIS